MVAIKQVKAVNDATGNVVDALLSVMNKLGIREANIPGKDELGVLIHHLLTNYGNHTCDEIRLAFDMAIAGKLELLQGESVNCYENFSCLYLSSILNAYRRWAAQAHRQLQPKELPEPPKEELTDVTMRDWMEDVKKRKLAVDFMPVMIYDWLEKKGELVKTPAEKHEYLQEAVAYRQSKLAKACEEMMNQDNREALQKFIQMKESGVFSGPEANTLKSLAKKMILFDFLFHA